MMIVPILYSVVFKSVRFELVCTSWVIVVAFIAISAAIAEATQIIGALVVYIPLSMIILYENQRQNLSLYFIVKKQNELLVENARMAEEAQTELRYMIANVAHDLKTVRL